MSIPASEMEKLSRAVRETKDELAIAVPPISINQPATLQLDKDDPNENLVEFATEATIYALYLGDVIPRAQTVIKTKPLPRDTAQSLAQRILSKPGLQNTTASTESLAEIFMANGASVTVFPPLSSIQTQR